MADRNLLQGHGSFSTLDAEYRESLRRHVRARCEEAVEGYEGHGCAEALEEFIVYMLQNCYTIERMSQELKEFMGHAGEEMAAWVQYQVNRLVEQHAMESARVCSDNRGAT